MLKTSPSSAGSVGSVSDRGGKIPHASPPKSQNIKKKREREKQYFNKFNKDFKNGPQGKAKRFNEAAL